MLSYLMQVGQSFSYRYENHIEGRWFKVTNNPMPVKRVSHQRRAVL